MMQHRSKFSVAGGLLILATCLNGNANDASSQKSPVLKTIKEQQQQLSEEIERTRKRLQSLEESFKDREVWLKELIEEETEKIKVPQNPVDKTAKTESIEKVETAGERLIRLDFQEATWKEVFDQVKHPDGEFDVTEYPPGTVSFSGYRPMTLAEALTVINLKLENLGYALWHGPSGSRIVKYLPNDHPLIGTWRLEKIMNDGKVSSGDQPNSIKITQQNFFFEGRENDDAYNEHSYEIAANGQDLYWRFAFPGNDSLKQQYSLTCEGSFQVSGDRAAILLAHPTDLESDEAPKSLVYIKLKHRHKN